MRRSLDKEMMDLPGQPHALLVDDLDNLRRLNRYLGNYRNILRGLKRLLAQDPIDRFTLLDVGTGSADIPVRLARWAQAKQLGASITALERDAISLEQATQQTRGESGIALVRGDGATPPFRPGSFDYVLASQFLHHFSEEDVVELIRGWAKVARRAILVSDLVRHPVAYSGIRLLTALCTRNLMTRVDAPLSVRRAFTLNEWRALFQRANVGPFELRRALPFRIFAIVTLEH